MIEQEKNTRSRLADVAVRSCPSPSGAVGAGAGFEFVDAIKGGSVPKEYIPGGKEGRSEAMEAGVVAGYPVIDVKTTLFDGSYHEVDSSEHASKQLQSKHFEKQVCGLRRSYWSQSCVSKSYP
ncbi:MAG: hypothetical protein Ct9H300mP13_2820 [Gammaproteobacteria bacterium]|nr:MAG: hypothetical protein Ct9H300mP13_2820 [Gammaproteobacteria bacterium]